MSIGARIKSSRGKKGLSQAVLAKEIGVSTQAVSQWETGRTTPEFARLNQVANIIGVDVDWLFSGEGSDNFEFLEVTVSAIPLLDDFEQALFFAPYIVRSGDPRDEFPNSVIPTRRMIGRGFGIYITKDLSQGNFKEGDLCIFTSSETIKEGDMAIAIATTPGPYAGMIFGAVSYDDADDRNIDIFNIDRPDVRLSIAGSLPSLRAGRQMAFIVAIMVEHRRLLR